MTRKKTVIDIEVLPPKDIEIEIISETPSEITEVIIERVEEKIEQVEEPIESPEEVIEPKKTKTERVPAVIPLAHPGGLESVPDSKFPFYVLASDGLFLHRRNILGRGIVKIKSLPEHFPKLGETGWFEFEAPVIPAPLCASIVDFFRRIFEKHHSEAEVILLLNYETNEWSVMVPTQKVSYSGVDSRIDPLKVPEKNLIAGTMHSHCDFGAFHSGVDTGDADDMDGIHFTIGHINSDTPQVASMVSLNKVQFKYDWEELADFSDLSLGKAPEEWDDFVTYESALVSGHKPVGFELFEKYKKPSTYKPSTNAIVPWTPPAKTTVGPWWEKEQWWEKPEQQRNSNPQLWSDSDNTSDSLAYYDYWTRTYARDNPTLDGDDIMEGLPDSIIDSILSTNCITDEDMDAAVEAGVEAKNVLWWRLLLMKKMSSISSGLEDLGINVEFKMRVKKEGE